MNDLPDTMRALVLHEAGAPLQLEQVPRPVPGPGEALVQVAASPINPSDLAMLSGEYGLGWPYPLIPGLEGSGKVVGVGRGLHGRIIRGRNVAVAADKQGLWAEYVVVPTTRLVPLPPDLPLGVGASSFVNPLTAIALVDEVKQAGQNAAISTAAAGALGAMIRRRAKQKGVALINIVRRAEQVEALRRDGAQYVLSESDPEFDADLAALCKQLRCRMAFDAVGGSMTFRMAQALRTGGQILIYGGLSGAASSLHPGTMIFRGLTVRGFWLSQWLSRKSAPQMMRMAREVKAGLRDGFAQTHIARTVTLDDAVNAPAEYEAAMSAGKVLIATGAFALGVD